MSADPVPPHEADSLLDIAWRGPGAAPAAQRERRRAERRRRQVEATEADFLQALNCYRNARLMEQGFADPAMKPLGDRSPLRRTFATPGRVWKFYASSQFGLLRNSAAAARFLESAGVPAPRVLHEDAPEADQGSGAVGCIVMERLPGGAPAPGFLAREGREVASLLTRVHSLTSERDGPLAPAPPPGRRISGLQAELTGLLDLVAGLGGLVNQPPMETAAAWFRAWVDARSAAGTGFQFTSGDLQCGNFVRLPDGAYALVDLDDAGFRFFGIDLANLILSATPPSIFVAAMDDPDRRIDRWEEHAAPLLEAYFGHLPDLQFRRWREARIFNYAFALLRFQAIVLSALRPGWREFRRVDIHGAVAQCLRLRTALDALTAQPPPAVPPAVSPVGPAAYASPETRPASPVRPGA